MLRYYVILNFVVLSLYPLSISTTPSVPTRTRKSRRQPFIVDQITRIRPLPTVQSQAGFKEFHDLRDIFRWNVSARGKLAFKSFLRYHPCKYSYGKHLDCIDSIKVHVPFSSKNSFPSLASSTVSGLICSPVIDISQPINLPSSSDFSAGTRGFPVSSSYI